MNVVAQIKPSLDFTSEWKRIEILSRCLIASRDYKKPDSLLVKELAEIQQQVEFNRSQPGYWGCITNHSLTGLAQELLVCVYAPFFNPDVALLYQELQQEKNTNPSIAFIHKLLALESEKFITMQYMCFPNGEMIQNHLIKTDGGGPLIKLVPEKAVLAQLAGIPGQLAVIPGAVHITLGASWDELVLPMPQKRMLREYMQWINYSDKVVNDWNAQPVGGPVALFTGVSGTGKTYTASVIANTLGWSLYRVDLASLVSKYIGETEKNINAVFEAAEGQNIVLQFDEVDALMGKRGEVKDARDRYANMEVSHLLTRIEQHHGPCILTTNLSKQIDSAFTRRFHFVISFPRPEYKQRLDLWRLLVPAGAPISSEIDFDIISDSVSLSGGEIRNAAMHAAIIAASQKREIRMEDISTGIWRVVQKTDGKSRIKQLRQLAAYLPEEIYASDKDE